MVTQARALLSIILLAYSCVYVNSQENNTILHDPMPQQWTYASEFAQTLPTEDKWWQNFNDKTLDTLMSIAIENNYDLQIALKRIALAKSSIKIVQGGYYPAISFDTGWTKDRISGKTENAFNMGVNYNWEIDLFGKITSQANAKKAMWKASKSQYDGTMVSLCANIATAYINLRTWQTQFLVAQTHLDAQKRILDMTEARYKSGLASMLDVSQAKTVYMSTMSTISPLKANIESQINSIALLLGIDVNKMPSGIMNANELPKLQYLIPVGVPSDLLRRRPDIKEAEYTLASYAASIGIAKKDFLPTLSLSGNIGFKSSSIDDLFKKGSFIYSIEPSLSWTLFDGLSRKYELIEAKEQYMIGIDNYNYTVKTAIKEVENSMISYKYMLMESQELEKVTNEALNTLKLSVDLYKRGLTDFTNVLTSEQSYLEYNNSLVASKGKTILALISIYQALGGGWNTNLDY